MKTKLIQLEFNELCPTLVDRFCAQGKLPNFQKLRSASAVYVTDAGEDPPNLEPWIQWVTVHTGLPYSEHKVFDLGDGHKLNVPRVWDIVGETGDNVWICGSMNASFRKPIQGYILPDPWSTGIHPYPEGEFESFFHFIRTSVQEHTRAESPLSKADQLKFLTFMLRRGMSTETATTIVRQLMSERSGANRWKRAAILDRLLWDVFTWYWVRHKPAFSTFFLNSTAHFQHMYWRNMDPEKFAVKPTPGEQDEYGDAVLFGYQQMDHLIGRCLELAGNDTAVVLATALSQQPCVKYEDTGGKVFYRPNDPEKLLEFVGVAAKAEFAPVMSEQFRYYFSTETAAADAGLKLGGLKMNGKSIMLARVSGNEVFSGCSVFETVQPSQLITNIAGESKKFAELFYNCNLVKSGMHHRDGIFWIKGPAVPAAVHPGRLELTRVAPTLLSIMGYTPPKTMEQPVHLELAHA
jgi:hypothetical protein